MVKLYKLAQTLVEIKYTDYWTKKKVTIPKGTLCHVIDMYDDHCTVEFVDHDADYDDTWEYYYDQVEYVDESRVDKQ